MRDSQTNEKFPCDFGADTAAFLYNELNPAERANFESHLSACGECAAEIADFQVLHSSIRDWKTSTFDNLATPRIVIPYQSAKSEAMPTFFEKIRAAFNFVPAFSAGLAIFLLAIIGFGWLMLHNQSTTEIASNLNRPAETPRDISTPVVKQSSDDTIDLAADQKDLNDNAASNHQSEPRIVKTSVSNTHQNKSIKITAGQNKSADKNQPRDKKSQNDNQTLQAEKIPRLNSLPDEEDDDDLRLADLFADKNSK